MKEWIMVLENHDQNEIGVKEENIIHEAELLEPGIAEN